MKRRGFLKAIFGTAVAVATGGLAILARIPRPRLRCKYTLESARNLEALHGLDTEKELVEEMAQDLRNEIDQGILDDVPVVSFRIEDRWVG